MDEIEFYHSFEEDDDREESDSDVWRECCDEGISQSATFLMKTIRANNRLLF